LKRAINIRALTANDEADWRRLWSDYLKFYNTKVSDEIYRTTFARLLSTEDSQSAEHEFDCLLATHDNETVGLVHFLSHRHCWRLENVIYLQDLYVDQKARGSGAGRALINAVYEHADHQGTPNVYWLTQSDNFAAQKLYDQLAHKTDFIKYQR